MGMIMMGNGSHKKSSLLMSCAAMLLVGMGVVAHSPVLHAQGAMPDGAVPAAIPAELVIEGMGEVPQPQPLTDDLAATEESNGRFADIDPEALLDMDAALQRMAVIRPVTIKPQEIGTLVFTLWQHSLLQQAKQSFTTRNVTQEEIDRAKSGELEDIEKPKGLRELSLSGILYKGKDDWVVWLNGQRLAPNALPKQVMDIKVSENHIDLKWFDEYSNLIYPVRMRPHQRFNLDSRIFLPGLTSDAAAQMQAVSR